MKHSLSNTAEYAWLHVVMAIFILVSAYTLRILVMHAC